MLLYLDLAYAGAREEGEGEIKSRENERGEMASVACQGALLLVAAERAGHRPHRPTAATLRCKSTEEKERKD
jgi:hypothetical protein